MLLGGVFDLPCFPCILYSSPGSRAPGPRLLQSPCLLAGTGKTPALEGHFWVRMCSEGFPSLTCSVPDCGVPWPEEDDDVAWYLAADTAEASRSQDVSGLRNDCCTRRRAHRLCPALSDDQPFSCCSIRLVPLQPSSLWCRSGSSPAG